MQAWLLLLLPVVADACDIYIDFGSSGPKVYHLQGGGVIKRVLKIDGPGCMTAYTAPHPSECNHNCRKERCDSGPSLVEQIQAAMMTVQVNATLPCVIKAIRATAGNRLVTVDNSRGWSELKQDLANSEVQFEEAELKTIPGTEEALNEFYDAIANNEGSFNGYLGWGGASLQIALKVDTDPFAAVDLVPGVNFPGCMAGTNGCGANEKTDFLKFVPGAIPEYPAVPNTNKEVFRGGFEMISFLSDRNTGGRNIIGGNDETYAKVRALCDEAQSTLRRMASLSKVHSTYVVNDDVMGALEAWKDCMRSDSMWQAIGESFNAVAGDWEPILVSQAMGNFGRSGMAKVVNLERQGDGGRDVVQWMKSVAVQHEQSLERRAEGVSPLVEVLKKMAGDHANFFNGGAGSGISGSFVDVLAPINSKGWPPTCFGAMYLASVLSVLSGSDEDAYRILLNAKTLGGKAEPIYGYLELTTGTRVVEARDAATPMSGTWELDGHAWKPVPLSGSSALSALERDVEALLR